MFQKILVAVDGSPGARSAAEVAMQMAACLAAHLEILSVEEAAPRYVSTRENIRQP